MYGNWNLPLLLMSLKTWFEADSLFCVALPYKGWLCSWGGSLCFQVYQPQKGETTQYNNIRQATDHRITKYDIITLIKNLQGLRHKRKQNWTLKKSILSRQTRSVYNLVPRITLWQLPYKTEKLSLALPSPGFDWYKFTEMKNVFFLNISQPLQCL